MFGISLVEIIIVAMVALVVVGPHKLPGMLRTVGGWVGKVRRLTTEVRQQTGIDDILRAEGIDGGLNELRSMVRGEVGSVARAAARQKAGSSAAPEDDPYQSAMEYDVSREYPTEGPDAYGALPDDLAALADDLPPDDPDPETESPAEAPSKA